MKKIKPIYLVLLSSFLMIIAWPPMPTAIFLFIGFVPLLILHQQLALTSKKHLKFWIWSYLSLFLFNVGTTWWVWNASASGAIMMLFANSLILSLPFLLFSITNSILPKTKYQSFIIYYLAVEYWHFNWSASWPWLSLGKGLACYPSFIQWYEWTGEMGGTFLILIINVMLFNIYSTQKTKELWKPIALLLTLSIVSFVLKNYLETQLKLQKRIKNIECVVVQPQIDPYKEKFNSSENYLTPFEQIDIAIDLAKPLLNSNTKILVLPETAIVGENDLNSINSNETIKRFNTLFDSFPNLLVLSGAEVYKTYYSKTKPSKTARNVEDSYIWWDSYNTALLINKDSVLDFYHKSRLVPGVEKMPFEFLESLSINLGGTSGSLATSPKAKNFEIEKQIKIAPLICYESVFGEYATEFIRDSANMLAVITNDGWWHKTPGYQQHLLFGAIRCIETRKDMLRSANVGVSAKINQFGEISKATKYNDRSAFVCNIRPNTYQTLFVKYGNIIGKMSLFIGLALIVGTFVKKFSKN